MAYLLTNMYNTIACVHCATTNVYLGNRTPSICHIQGPSRTQNMHQKTEWVFVEFEKYRI